MDVSGRDSLERISSSIRPAIPDDVAVGFIFSNLLMLITTICV